MIYPATFTPPVASSPAIRVADFGHSPRVAFFIHCIVHGWNLLSRSTGRLSFLYKQLYFVARKRLYKLIQEPISFLNALGGA